MPRTPRVLISGAGIAGPALAWWLTRSGFTTTVVERHPAVRAGGNGVDLRGEVIDIVDAMRIGDRIRDHATEIDRLRFVDGGGAITAAVDMAAFAAPGDIEIGRADLTRILYDATRDDVEYRFGDSISTMDEVPDGVGVDFVHGRTGHYDLVIGADGLHSTVRRLAGMDDIDHLRHFGLSFATATVPGDLGPAASVTLHNTPGTVAGVYRSGHGPGTGFFLFRHESTLEHRDVAGHRDLLRAKYSGQGWIIPELVETAVGADTFYLDSVTQVRLPRWSRGRVALLGDAGYCPTLLSGSGASLAIEGARALAAALDAADRDQRTGFARYEAALRGTVARRQRQVRATAAMLVPRSRSAIRWRDRACRVLNRWAAHRRRR